MTAISRPWPAARAKYFTACGVPGEAVAAADRFVAAAQQATDRSLYGLKISLGANLFLWHLDAFERDADPTADFIAVFDGATDILQRAQGAAWFGGHFPPSAVKPETSDVGEIYSATWQLLDDEAFFDKTRARMAERLRLNDVDPRDLFGGKVILDAGCGCGNYAAAMAGFGAREVIAIDIGEAGLAFGEQMMARSPYAGTVRFRPGSATAIPLPDNSVDVVWSNSVVHVTGAYEAALAEAARVLKPGGTFFLYVDGKFGLFELLVNSLLSVFGDIPQPLFQHAMAAAGVDAGRIGWMAANFYVPYERRPQAEVEALLRSVGFSNLRQLRRGVAIDQIEQVSQQRPFASLKYGEAQLKYLCRKTA